MINSKLNSGGHWWIVSAIVLGVLMLSATPSFGQTVPAAAPAADAKPDAKAETPAATPAAPEAKTAETTAAPTNEEPGAKTPPAAPDATAKPNEAAKTGSTAPAPGTGVNVEAAPAAPATGEKTAPKADTSMPAGKSAPSVASKVGEQVGAGEEVSSGGNAWLLGLVILALFVLPVMAGNYLAKIWKMPDHGWKISLVLGTFAASVLICLFGTFKFGPDLAGGITLIYELAETPTATATNQPQQPQGGHAETQIKSGSREFKLSELISALKKRIDPDGTKEITIREYGPAVEIIIPQVGQDEMEFVKQKITKMGELEFRITADRSIRKDQPVIDSASKLKPNQKDVMIGDVKMAEWVPYDVKELGPVEREDSMVKRKAGDTPEALVLMDPFNVTGEYLIKATKGIDEHGAPAVHFSFNQQGASRFEKLTGQNLPNPATGNVHRRLGILLDKTLHSAPNIQDKISSEGRISGGQMTDREVDLTIEVLNAGSLPAALNKMPVSEAVISPTLGGETVQHGKDAITASLIGVVLFMLVYYRFSGFVASLGLALNLLMVLALMVLIKAAFTLPGIAGLALTVGMSVDTNVLIYERIREELKSGAALRMAIRNGFSRAMVAIIDTHLSTIISGIVLFSVGTDQVKGFAVTLILGLLCNLFTAYFCTRVIFDIAERRGWIKQLNMMHIFREPNYDFLSIRWVALGASWVLIIIGMIAVYYRGSSLLDIDFTGGSSVAFALNEPMPLDKVRNLLAEAKIGEAKLGDKNLIVVERGEKHTDFAVDTSEQSVESVKQVINNEFGNKLKKYSFEYRDLKPVKEPDFTGVETTLLINAAKGFEDESGVSYEALREQVAAALAKTGHANVKLQLSNPNYRPGSSVRFKEWSVRIPDLDEAATRPTLDQLQATMRSTALFPLASKIGGRVSGNMQSRALAAIAVSLVAMIVYLWLRFAKPSYGIAAGVALIHDVLITVGMLALSAYIVTAIPSVAQLLRIEAFQINLTIVAALLTIIGFSVNDTIVTFDRLREIKGKSPAISAKMVNDAVNQTLSRTILTVFTVFIVVVILYFFGGEGVHSFAFAFLVGIVTGTYSSVYIASPVVLWLSGVSAAPPKEVVSNEAPKNVRGMQPAR